MGALESKAALEQSATHDVGKLPEYSVYGRTPEQNERYAKFLEDSEKKLAERYSQPNLWNVAAAFAKPQLGGFLASLGSASEELGRNEEQRRAQELPLFKVRAEVEARRANLENQRLASELLNEGLATGKPIDENRLAKITGLVGKDDRIAQAAYQNSDLFLRLEQNKRGNISTSIEGQKAALENPAIVLNDPMFKGTVAEAQPGQIDNYLKALDSARPQGVSEDEWKSMGVTARSAAVARQANAKQEQSMSENQKFLTRAQNADNLIGELEPLRELAMDKNVAPIFSAFRDGDLISMYRAYLDKNPGNQGAAVEGMVNAAMDRMKNKDEATRAKVDKLVKGVAALELNLRGSNINPTDALTVLNSSRSPSLSNSRDGFVGILDQMALQADRDIALYNYRVNAKLGENEYFRDSSLRQKYRDQAVELAKTNSADSKPSWYSASSGAGMGKQAADKTRASQATAPAPAASGATSAARPSADVIAEIKAAKAAQAAQAAKAGQ